MRQTMRALVLQGWGMPLADAEVPIPSPVGHDVLVLVRTCGVGLTTVKVRQGSMVWAAGAGVPRIIGHEIAGEVVSVGPDVASVEVGARVVVHFSLTCNRCKRCTAGHEPLCEAPEGLVGVSRDGGLAEYVALPESNLVVLPESVSDLAASMAADALLTPWHALRTVAGLRPADTLVVVGAGGGVGVHAVMIGRVLGARVIAVDIAEPRLELARRNGAAAAVDGRGDVVAAVLSHTDGRGADVVLDYVASADTQSSALAYLAAQGRLVVQGVSAAVERVPYEPAELMRRELGILGSRYGSRRELCEVVDMLARGVLEPVVTETVPLTVAAVEDLLVRMEANAVPGRAAVVIDGPRRR